MRAFIKPSQAFFTMASEESRSWLDERAGGAT